VSQLIDAASRLARVPSFGLARIRRADQRINDDAWSGATEAQRQRIFSNAEHGAWSDADFERIKKELRFFMAQGWGRKAAEAYADAQVDVNAWIEATTPRDGAVR
jgi:hypothetical protein